MTYVSFSPIVRRPGLARILLMFKVGDSGSHGSPAKFSGNGGGTCITITALPNSYSVSFIRS